VKSRASLFFRKTGYLHAVDGISFKIGQNGEGEVFCLVGESGSGKTTTASAIVHLTAPTSGKILFEGIDITSPNKKELKEIRRRIQMILQDPFESLPPHMTIYDILSEPFITGKIEPNPIKRKEMILKAMESVKLIPPESFLGKFPHQISGGQRQRVAIAATLILNPRLIIADEPVSMLDMSVRAEILDLMFEIKDKYSLAYIFITHDLALARIIGTKIAVMYLGKIMEMGDARKVIKDHLHPYTKALISVTPRIIASKREKLILKGEIQSGINIPKGCRFQPRCPMRGEICSKEEPPFVEVDHDHFVYCHFPG
jgi:peptide/nickel transport system ATP-binding protein